MRRANAHALTVLLQSKLNFVQVGVVKYWPGKGWYAYQPEPDEPPTCIGQIWSDAIEYISNLSDDSETALLELEFDALLQTESGALFTLHSTSG